MKERDLNIQDVLRLEPEARRRGNRRGQGTREEEEEEEEGKWPLPSLQGCPTQARPHLSQYSSLKSDFWLPAGCSDRGAWCPPGDSDDPVCHSLLSLQEGRQTRLPASRAGDATQEAFIKLVIYSEKSIRLLISNRNLVVPWARLKG